MGERILDIKPLTSGVSTNVRRYLQWDGPCRIAASFTRPLREEWAIGTSDVGISVAVRQPSANSS